MARPRRALPTPAAALAQSRESRGNRCTGSRTLFVPKRFRKAPTLGAGTASQGGNAKEEEGEEEEKTKPEDEIMAMLTSTDTVRQLHAMAVIGAVMCSVLYTVEDLKAEGVELEALIPVRGGGSGRRGPQRVPAVLTRRVRSTTVRPTPLHACVSPADPGEEDHQRRPHVARAPGGGGVAGHGAGDAAC